MIRDVGMHRANNTDIIDAGSDMRKEVADLDPGFAVLPELKRRHQQAACLSFRLEFRVGWTLPIVLFECRLWVERVHLGGTTIHKQMNDMFGSWSKMRHSGCHWVV